MDRIAYMKSVNFEFLRPGNELLANLAGLAEAVLHIDPGSALTRLRSFAEELTKAIYKEELLPRMPQSTFYDLVKNSVFTDCVSKPLVHQINFLRIQGNDTAHGAEGDLRNAQLALKTAHQLAMYMAIKVLRHCAGRYSALCRGAGSDRDPRQPAEDRLQLREGTQSAAGRAAARHGEAGPGAHPQSRQAGAAG